MARTTKRDWYMAALQILMEQGDSSLTIEGLTQRLGLTKGSFYHHFGSMEGFKTHLLAFFEQEGTLQVVEQVEAGGGSAFERLKTLMHITVAHPAAIEVAIRTWAQRDAAVRDYQARMDAHRLAYVAGLWRELIDDPAEAQLRAELLYVILIGSEHLQPPLEGAAKLRLYHAYLRAYQLDE